MSRSRLLFLVPLCLVAFLLFWLVWSRSVLPPPNFTVCFEPPIRKPLPADVRKLVDSYSPKIEAALAAAKSSIKPYWLKAILAHESGGSPSAISPTGCVGALAICRNAVNWKGNPPRKCCENRANEPSPYDRCNEEKKTGYHCAPANDPRFEISSSLQLALGILGPSYELIQEQKTLNETQQLAALGLAYNGGRTVFRNYAKNYTSLEPVLSALDLGAAPSYRAWRPEDLARKVVEIADYYQWMEWLGNEWRGIPAEEEEPHPRYTCFINETNRLTRSDALPRDMRPLKIVRLSFGKYLPAEVHFKN